MVGWSMAEGDDGQAPLGFDPLNRSLILTDLLGSWLVGTEDRRGSIIRVNWRRELFGRWRSNQSMASWSSNSIVVSSLEKEGGGSKLSWQGPAQLLPVTF